jgi:XTP/dITP diphosphohydrolase
MKLVLASNNAKKLAELQVAVRRRWAWRWCARASWASSEADEPYGTFIENALAKARHAAARHGPAGAGRRLGPVRRRAGRRCRAWIAGPLRGIADPQRRPRRRTRRVQDAANNALLARSTWQARATGARASSAPWWRCATTDDPRAAGGRGPLVGRDPARAPWGEGGFGYDPLMYDPAGLAARWPSSRPLKNRHEPPRPRPCAQLLRLLSRRMAPGAAGAA